MRTGGVGRFWEVGWAGIKAGILWDGIQDVGSWHSITLEVQGGNISLESGAENQGILGL